MPTAAAGIAPPHTLRDAPVVTLLWHEVAMASRVGLSRQLNALARGNDEADGRDDTPGWNDHIEGACGELATARYLGLYWGGSVNTFRFGGDVGEDIQVRTRSLCWYELKVKKADRDDDVFVLALGHCPIYHLYGWCYAGDVRAYLADRPRVDWTLDPNGRKSPALFVPQSALRPMAELKAGLRPARGLAREPAGGYPAAVANNGCPLCRPLHTDLQLNSRTAHAKK